MADPWAGKAAVVTGAASGIGRAGALAFARRGVRVLAADVDAKGGEETVGRIARAGGEALFVRTDVSLEGDVERMVGRCVEAFGRLDYAFNNAGTDQPTGELHLYAEADWDRILGVNLKGVWLCMKHQIPHLLKRGGALVNTASVLGLKGSRGVGPYVASKHGVVGLSRAAALEYAPRGVRVNALCPGSVETPMFLNFVRNDPERMARNQAGIPLGRRGTAEELGELAVWLCSEEAAFVVGHALVADGGAVV